MNRRLLLLLVAAWSLALAQDPPAEDPTPETPAAQPTENGAERDAGTDTDADDGELTEAEKAAKAMADEDFKPGDEISEDYPVPLPSDI